MFKIYAVLLAFIVNTLGPLPTVWADDGFLPAPGTMVPMTAKFNPLTIKGIKLYPDNPFKFDFIVDTGDLALSKEQVKEQGQKLASYFLASLTVPEKEMWVNLSPYEKSRIIPFVFGDTEMGKELLSEDYILKQIMATALYPEQQLGKEFWKKIYEQSSRDFGTTQVPVNTFNKVWIVPDEAVVYENASSNAVFVVKSRLKVMLEADYLSANKHKAKEQYGLDQENLKSGHELSSLSSKIIKEVVIPALEKEVNEGRNFFHLRQVYQALILAAWYKKNLKDNVLAKGYVDRGKTFGVDTKDKGITEKIYAQYLNAYRKGVYNYVKEEMDPASQQMIPRKYFSGGVDATNMIANLAMATSSEIKKFYTDMAMRAGKRLLLTLGVGLLLAAGVSGGAQAGYSDHMAASLNAGQLQSIQQGVYAEPTAGGYQQAYQVQAPQTGQTQYPYTTPASPKTAEPDLREAAAYLTNLSNYFHQYNGRLSGTDLGPTKTELYKIQNMLSQSNSPEAKNLMTKVQFQLHYVNTVSGTSAAPALQPEPQKITTVAPVSPKANPPAVTTTKAPVPVQAAPQAVPQAAPAPAPVVAPVVASPQPAPQASSAPTDQMTSSAPTVPQAQIPVMVGSAVGGPAQGQIQGVTAPEGSSSANTNATAYENYLRYLENYVAQSSSRQLTQADQMNLEKAEEYLGSMARVFNPRGMSNPTAGDTQARIYNMLNMINNMKRGNQTTVAAGGAPPPPNSLRTQAATLRAAPDRADVDVKVVTNLSSIIASVQSSLPSGWELLAIEARRTDHRGHAPESDHYPDNSLPSVDQWGGPAKAADLGLYINGERVKGGLTSIKNKFTDIPGVWLEPGKQDTAKGYVHVSYRGSEGTVPGPIAYYFQSNPYMQVASTARTQLAYVNQAMLTTTGGIDLEKLVLTTKGKGVRTAFSDPKILQMLLEAKGLFPKIQTITPLTVPMVRMLLGANFPANDNLPVNPPEKQAGTKSLLKTTFIGQRKHLC